MIRLLFLSAQESEEEPADDEEDAPDGDHGTHPFQAGDGEQIESAAEDVDANHKAPVRAARLMLLRASESKDEENDGVGKMLGIFSTLDAAKARAGSAAPREAPTAPTAPAKPAEAPSAPPEAPSEAPAKPTTTQDTATPGRTAGLKHDNLLGFSACSVAKALARVSVKFDEADRIMKARGITMTKPSLGVQLRLRAQSEELGAPRRTRGLERRADCRVAGRGWVRRSTTS